MSSAFGLGLEQIKDVQGWGSPGRINSHGFDTPHGLEKSLDWYREKQAAGCHFNFSWDTGGAQPALVCCGRDGSRIEVFQSNCEVQRLHPEKGLFYVAGGSYGTVLLPRGNLSARSLTVSGCVENPSQKQILEWVSRNGTIETSAAPKQEEEKQPQGPLTLATSTSPEESGSGQKGVYFGVRSDGPAVTLTALNGGGMLADIQATVWACEGSGAGKETERGAWRQVGAGTLKGEESTRLALSSPVLGLRQHGDAARGHPRAEQDGLRRVRRQDRGGWRGAVSRAVNAELEQCIFFVPNQKQHSRNSQLPESVQRRAHLRQRQLRHLPLHNHRRLLQLLARRGPQPHAEAAALPQLRRRHAREPAAGLASAQRRRCRAQRLSAIAAHLPTITRSEIPNHASKEVCRCASPRAASLSRSPPAAAAPPRTPAPPPASAATPGSMRRPARPGRERRSSGRRLRRRSDLPSVGQDRHRGSEDRSLRRVSISALCETRSIVARLTVMFGAASEPFASSSPLPTAFHCVASCESRA